MALPSGAIRDRVSRHATDRTLAAPLRHPHSHTPRQLALFTLLAVFFCLSRLCRAAVPLLDPVPSFANVSAGFITCTPVTSTVACSPWTGLKMPTGKDTSGSVYQDYDTGLVDWAVSKNAIAAFNTRFGCTWDGFGLQYQITYGCAVTLVQHRECQSDGSPPMCRSTCQGYMDSIAALFNTVAVCPRNANFADDRALALTDIGKVCMSATASNNTAICIPVVPLEASRCGFVNNDVAAAYCKQTFNETYRRPACCDSLTSDQPVLGPALAASATPKFLINPFRIPAVTQTAASNTGLIAGAAVGGILALLALALLGWCLLRRHRRKRESEGMRHRLAISHLSHFGGKSDYMTQRHSAQFDGKARSDSGYNDRGWASKDTAEPTSPSIYNGPGLPTRTGSQTSISSWRNAGLSLNIPRHSPLGLYEDMAGGMEMDTVIGQGAETGRKTGRKKKKGDKDRLESYVPTYSPEPATGENEADDSAWVDMDGGDGGDRRTARSRSKTRPMDGVDRQTSRGSQSRERRPSRKRSDMPRS